MFTYQSNSLVDFLGPYASYALKKAAEDVITEKVESYRKLVVEAVYHEVEKISIKFAETMATDDARRQIHIIIDDRLEKNKK